MTKSELILRLAEANPHLFHRDVERIVTTIFDEVAEAHRRLETGGLDGKLVLCPDLPSRLDRVPAQREPRPTSVQAPPATLL